MKKLQDILDAARQHGLESHPDHEVGDLSIVLRSCWRLMSPEHKRTVLEEATDELEMWAAEIPCPDCNEVGEPDCKTCGGAGILTAAGNKIA